MVIREYIEKHSQSLAELIFGCVAGTCGMLTSPAIATWLLVLNERRKKEINFWLEDAVIVNAYSKTIARKRFSPITPIGVKLQLDFEIEGVHHCVTNDSADTKNNQGYLTLMTSFADKNLDVLYSPKYNQVMFFK